MSTTPKDLQPYKNKLMELTYEEKMQMSEWLHTQIDFERAEHVKKKGQEVTQKIGTFFEKAAEVTKVAGNSLLDQFKGASNETQSNNNTGVIKR